MKKLFGLKKGHEEKAAGGGGSSGGQGSSNAGSRMSDTQPERLKARLSLGGEADKKMYTKADGPGFQHVEANLKAKPIKENDLQAEDIE